MPPRRWLALVMIAQPRGDVLGSAVRGTALGDALAASCTSDAVAWARASGSSSQDSAHRASSSETSRHVRYSGNTSASARRLTRLMYFDLMNHRATQRSKRLIL